MNHKKSIHQILGIAILAAAALSGCTLSDRNAENPKLGPAPQVQYAIDRVSPAVVRLDIVQEEFSSGLAKANRSLGSGAIIDKEGHVLTNFHVAGRAKRIDITLANQEHVRATLVGSDHWTDLALVKLDMEEVKRKGNTFEAAELGDSSTVKLGQPVMALGTPFGLTRTLTAGIVSNTDRFFDESNIDGYETGWFNNWIQTDAAINPGNSGGPLIDLQGKIIGINTRGNRSGNNLGFAIPSNVARQVVAELMAHKTVARSYIGAQLQQLQDLESFYDLKADHGVLIRSVDPGSPAEKAGLQPEDILLSVDGVAVTARFPEHLAAVRRLISEKPIGSEIKMTFQRKNAGSEKSQTVTVKTEKLESVITEERAIGAWGMSVRNLTRAYLRDKRLPIIQGVLITGVRDASTADAAGLRDGDIIVRIAQKPVTDLDELDSAIKAWETNKKPILVDIRRDRSEKTVIIKPRD